jgi:NAD(P)H-nitrite reductase large subunit
LETNKIFEDKYDKLMIASGTSAIIPPIPGIKEATNLHVLKTPDHLQEIMKNLKNDTKKAIVIGGGFIGIEIAENCKKRGMQVSIVDFSKIILSKIVDEDFSVFISKALIENGIDLKVNTGVTSIEDNGKTVVLSSGKSLHADIIFMVIGTKTETKIFEEAGIKVGTTCGLLVNKSSQTNDPDIYATGDIAETVD